MQEECGAFLSAEHAEAGFSDDCGLPQGEPQGAEGGLQGFVKACAELHLLGKKTFAVDGTKIRASNSKKKSFTPQILEKKLDYLREQESKIEGYLDKMDQEDETEQKHARILELDIHPKDMPEKLTQIRERIGKYEDYQKRMKETGEDQIQETDPECRTIYTKEGLQPAYNIQTVVDAKHHLIASFDTTNANTDQGQLDRMAEQTKHELKIRTAEFIADKGYESRADIEKCVMHGTLPNVGFKYDKDERIFDLEYIPAEIDEGTRSSRDPKDIQKCLHAGVLPRCYENTTISVQVQERNVVSCFIRHEDGQVTCPIGRELYKQHERKYGIVYKSQEACRTCPNRCTDSQKCEGGADRPQLGICAGVHVRQSRGIASEDPGRRAEFALQPLWQAKTKGCPREAHPPPQPGRHAEAKGAGRASVRDDQVVRRRTLLPVQRKGKGERRNRPQLPYR